MKRANKQTAPEVTESASLCLPATSERDRLVEIHRREGYDVRCENGIIMFYGNISYEKARDLLRADGYNASFGVTKAKLKS